jgi:hypothetical protein
MNVRFFSGTKDGRGIVSATVDLAGIVVAREEFSLARAKDISRRLAIAVEDAERFDRALGNASEKNRD